MTSHRPADDGVMRETRIVDSYGLSPMQQGMLFHSLESAEPGVDVEQIVCRLDEAVDERALHGAWLRVVERHPILRTSFRVSEDRQLLQDVHDRVVLPVDHRDWRARSASERADQWAALLEEERRRGVDLAAAPAMRLTLVRMAETTWWLLWTFHHALLDGRSFPLVLREVFALYAAARDGRELEVATPRPYRDYIEWLKGQDLSRAESFWRTALKGISAPTPLAGGHPAAATAGGRGVHEARLPVETTARLERFAREEGVTLNTLVQGAWAVLLQRYSGELEVVFGATRACRRSTVPGADDMIGLFINTLPVRVPVDPEARLGTWLRSLRERQVAVREFEHTPLVKVQGWSEVPRGTPLFESIVVFERYLLDTALRAEGGEWLQRRFEYIGQTSLPVTLIAYADTSLLLRLEHYRRRIDDDTAARMLGHVGVLLEGMLAGPDQRLGDLPLLTVAERDELVGRWGQGADRARVTECIHQRFQAQVARTPEAIAAVFEGQSLTYRQLDRRANRLAHRLRALGVGPDALVGLCVERSLEMVIGILGILKAGGAYLPLDPAYPADRLAFMIEDSAVAVLVTARELVGSLPAHRARVELLDDDSAVGDGAGDDAPPTSGVSPEHLAYVIYTSGSTGRPKGVLITHHNVVRLMDATAPWFRFGAQDVWTLFHSFAFDFSVWELWGPLLYGGRLVVVPYVTSRSPEAFHELLVAEGVTVLNQTPSAFRQLVQTAVAADPSRSLALRWVIFGGEALELAALRPWFERFGDQQPRLVNMYGITETTVHVTYRPVGWEEVRAATGSVIGRPIPDLTVHLLDARGQLVPLGVPGEIHVGGAGVARGYLNRPELTAQRFVPDPFGPPGARLYRSGDLARHLPGGDMEYLGRIDHQVKIRGFRIELGEIESVLAQHPAVRESVVIVREDRPGDKRLVGYYVTAPGAESIADELRELAREALPEYMVPAALVRLDALPLTANGKVDRRALPSPADAAPEPGHAYVAPRGTTEAALAEIWAGVLGVSRVGAHDNFFELGGDSILMIQVIARARQIGLRLSPRDLFRHATIAELAPLAGGGAHASSGPAEVEGPATLGPIQRWLLEQPLPELGHWNQAFVFELPAQVEADGLEHALREVVRHHDAFRLRVRRENGEWTQRHAPAGPPALELTRIDATALDAPDRRAAIETAARAAQGALDIERGPIIAAVHVRCGEGRPDRLILAVHHLVIDGVSWRVLMEDLETAYRARAEGQPVALPAKTTSFQQWTAALEGAGRAGAFAGEREHWRRIPAEGSLPVDDVEPGPDVEAAASTVLVTLPPEQTTALLQRAPEAFRTQVNEVLLAALGRALAGWTHRRGVTVALEGHGREAVLEGVDLSRTIGWFTSLFPVRLSVTPDDSILAALRGVKEDVRLAPGRGMGYGVLRYLDADPVLAAQPDPDLAFNYLGQFDQVLAGSSLFRFADEDPGPWHGAANPRRHAIEVLCQVRRGALEARWIYSEHRHRRETIERVAGQFIAALGELATAAAAPVPQAWTPSDFPLASLDQAALARLLADQPDTDDIYPPAPMQQLFLSMESARGQLGLEQWQFELRGPLDAAALHRAWDEVVRRHPMLRTAVASAGLSEPLLLVLRRAPIGWAEHDWRDLPAHERAARLEALLAEDRARGLDLARPPLARVILVRTGEEEHRLFWSTHHLHVDGWSWPLVFRDLAIAYEAYRQGRAPELERACPYRRYVGWLRERGDAGDESYWRTRLEGLTEPTALPLGAPAGARSDEDHAFAVATHRLSAAQSSALRLLARGQQVTLGTVIQGAWALVLHRVARVDDVVFGASFAGRPPDVPGIDEMVGPCVSNIPIRVRVAGGERVGNWLTGLQAEQAEANAHQYAALPRIQSWTRVPWRKRLFDSLLVFQNYLAGDEVERLGPTIALRTLAAPETTNYLLTVMVIPGPEIEVRLIYRRDRADDAAVARVLDAFRTVLEGMAEAGAGTVAELAGRVPADGLPGVAPVAVPVAPVPFAAPRTDVEQAIAALWAELFEVERVGLEDNFFDLGGQSVLLVQAHARLRSQLGIELPIVALFQYPTVASLAAHLSQAADETARFSDVRARAQRQREALARQRRGPRKES